MFGTFSFATGVTQEKFIRKVENWVEPESIVALPAFGISQINPTDGSASSPQTIESLLSGTNYTASPSVFAPILESIKLNVDGTDIRSLGYYGSVYSNISISLNKILSGYPNGFIMPSVFTGTAGGTIKTLTVVHSSAQYASHWDWTATGTYKNYTLNYITGGQIVSSYTILSASVLSLNPGISLFSVSSSSALKNEAGCAYSLSIANNAYYNFIATLSQYEKDLLIPPANRTNYWPKFSADSRIILTSGSDYTLFIENELAVGTTSDTIGISGAATNILWNRMFPLAMKSLDDENYLLQKLILTYGMMFDKIKLYQDQMAFAHSIPYTNYDHIPSSLVAELAKLWGWALPFATKNIDLSQYKLQTYANYVSAITQNLSYDDIVFEKWRRLTANLVNIYKSKGTRKALDFIMSVYSIPTALMGINEYLTVIDHELETASKSIPAPSSIFVVLTSTIFPTRVYVKSDGTTASTTMSFRNDKYLDITISEAHAIETDLYTWASSSYSAITVSGVNGKVLVLSGSFGSKDNWETYLLNKAIPSDGSYQTSTGSPILEEVYKIYLRDSVNKYRFGYFAPFISFIEKSFPEIVKQLIPTSSRLMSQGVEVANPFFLREKFVWPRQNNVSLPYYDTMRPISISFAVTPKTAKLASLTTTNLTSKKSPYASTGITSISTSARKYAQPQSNITVATTNFSRGSYFSGINPYSFTTQQSKLDVPNDLIYSPFIYSSATFNMVGPILLENTSAGQTGTSYGLYTGFRSSTLILTNSKFLTSYYDATVSKSGYSQVVFELFRKKTTQEKAIINSIPYTILATFGESNDTESYGTYKVSSISGLAIGNKITVDSYLIDGGTGKTALIVALDEATNQITTTPSFGLDFLRLGRGGNEANLISFNQTSGYADLTFALDLLDYDQLIDIFIFLIDADPTEDEYRTTLRSIADQSSINYNLILKYCLKFISYSMPMRNTCYIILNFLKDNRSYSIYNDSKHLSNILIELIGKLTFYKNIENFDWSDPVQSLAWDSYSGYAWSFPTVGALKNGTYTFSNTKVVLGGLDENNLDILVDNEEYFYRNKLLTEIYSSYTGSSGFTIIPKSLDGTDINVKAYDSNFRTSYVSGVPFFGNYFVYMNVPATPELVTYPPHSSRTNSAVYLEFRGVEDSSKLEVNFYYAGPSSSSQSPTNYSSITELMWTQTGLTFNIPVYSAAENSKIYSLQANLSGSSWFWWRIKNTKIKDTIFEYSVQASSTSEPKLFSTNAFSNIITAAGPNKTSGPSGT